MEKKNLDWFIERVGQTVRITAINPLKHKYLNNPAHLIEDEDDAEMLYKREKVGLCVVNELSKKTKDANEAAKVAATASEGGRFPLLNK